MFSNLKIQTYAFRYINVALREIKHYRNQSEKALEFRNFKLLEHSIGNWQIYKLAETKKRLNYNLADQFYGRKIMKKFFM